MAKAIHSMIRVLDEERSLAFYEKAFGLTVKDRLDFPEFALIYLSNPESEFELELTVNKSQTAPYDLGDGYGWPGNFRELEQCVRSVLVRGCYRPHANASPSTGRWLADADACRLPADELLDRYVAHAHARHGTHVATATALALDRRTVASRLERER